MAEISSSSSTTLIQKKYDVFISFRGTDTRDNILSHLHAALCRKQIVAFIDDQLRRGDDVPKALLRTIEESKISVIIFSKHYGSSCWCLDELVHIMKCREQNEQIVIPVFFKVDPSNVKNQSGPFGQALTQYKSHPRIQTWRDNLTKAANLSGWDSQVIRPEDTLIEKIVGDILNKLYYVSSSDNEGLVGIRSRIQHIKSMLNACSKAVKIMGIWGMGGIGKSTLAGAFFNKMFTQFQGSCFLANVREESQKHGLNILRKKLLVEVLKDDNINVATPRLGLSFIRNRLYHIKVLIVLDDVDDSNHLEFLSGGHDWFGQGSVIIITSRDKQVLQNGVDCVYMISGLDDVEALSLFSRYAFKEKYRIDSYHRKLSNKAITYAKGNPLALRILGSHLCGKSKQEQKSALMKLERTPIKPLQKVLLVSYEGLDHEERNLFLNIACFFKGMHIDLVKSFNDACGCYTDCGIRALIDKSLIIVKYGGQVHMHDLLQEMGRQIVRDECIEDPGKQSRLWDHMDIFRVLTENTGTEKVKGISLDYHNIALSINSTAFEKMCNLEFLEFNDFQNIYLPQDLKFLPNKLRYLRWGGYPLPSLPLSFHPENLVVLRMRGSHLQRLWNGRQNLAHLKEIDLTWSWNLVEIPDLSLAINLQSLWLWGCGRLENVFVKNNYNLKYLNLSNCSRMEKFPEVPLCGRLENLYLGGTRIKEVPSSISNLKFLRSLSLHDCKNFHTCIYKSKLPREIGLRLSSNERKHQEVDMHVRGLTNHPVRFPTVFLALYFARNNFQEIPVAIEQFTNLKYLTITDCRRLQSLPQLPMNITGISVENCPSLKMVASPLSISTKGVFENYDDGISFNFAACPKLDRISQNSIVTDAESRLLHSRATYPEIFSRATKICSLSFPGDVLDSLDYKTSRSYKTSGSSLTAKLPPHWCNDELCCLVFSIVIEVTDAPKEPCMLACTYHIRNNKGDSHSHSMELCSYWNREDAIHSNQVFLDYNQLFVNDWRIITKEADDVDEISIEFVVEEYSDFLGAYYTIKEWGVHLLYTHDIEDRCRRLMVQPNAIYGDPTHFSLDQSCMDHEIEESIMLEAEDLAYTFNNEEQRHIGKPLTSLLVVSSGAYLLVIGILKFLQWSSLLSSWKGIAISAFGLAIITIVMHNLIRFSESERSTPAKVAPVKAKTSGE